MKEIVIFKKATPPSKSKNPLENFTKLRALASQCSVIAKREAKEKGIAYTIIRHGIIYKVFPDGREVKDNGNRRNAPLSQ